MFLLSYIVNCTVCHIPACWVSLREGRGALAPQRPAFQELTPNHTTPTPLFACFPYRFPIQLPSASHQIRGYLQHHVQPGRNTAAAQQWLLVQGGVHAPKHGPLGTAPPGRQLRPGASSALPVRPADLLTVIPEQCWSVSPATPSFSFFFFKVLRLNNSFINRVLSPTPPSCSTRREFDPSCIYSGYNVKLGFVLLQIQPEKSVSLL